MYCLSEIIELEIKQGNTGSGVEHTDGIDCKGQGDNGHTDGGHPDVSGYEELVDLKEAGLLADVTNMQDSKTTVNQTSSPSVTTDIHSTSSVPSSTAQVNPLSDATTVSVKPPYEAEGELTVPDLSLKEVRKRNQAKPHKASKRRLTHSQSNEVKPYSKEHSQYIALGENYSDTEEFQADDHVVMDSNDSVMNNGHIDDLLGLGSTAFDGTDNVSVIDNVTCNDVDLFSNELTTVGNPNTLSNVAISAHGDEDQSQKVIREITADDKIPKDLLADVDTMMEQTCIANCNTAESVSEANYTTELDTKTTPTTQTRTNPNSDDNNIKEMTNMVDADGENTTVENTLVGVDTEPLNMSDLSSEISRKIDEFSKVIPSTGKKNKGKSSKPEDKTKADLPNKEQNKPADHNNQKETTAVFGECKDRERLDQVIEVDEELKNIDDINKKSNNVTPTSNNKYDRKLDNVPEFEEGSNLVTIDDTNVNVKKGASITTLVIEEEQMQSSIPGKVHSPKAVRNLSISDEVYVNEKLNTVAMGEDRAGFTEEIVFGDEDIIDDVMSDTSSDVSLTDEVETNEKVLKLLNYSIDTIKDNTARTDVYVKVSDSSPSKDKHVAPVTERVSDTMKTIEYVPKEKEPAGQTYKRYTEILTHLPISENTNPPVYYDEVKNTEKQQSSEKVLQNIFQHSVDTIKRQDNHDHIEVQAVNSVVVADKEASGQPYQRFREILTHKPKQETTHFGGSSEKLGDHKDNTGKNMNTKESDVSSKSPIPWRKFARSLVSRLEQQPMAGKPVLARYMNPISDTDEEVQESIEVTIADDITREPPTGQDMDYNDDLDKFPSAIPQKGAKPYRSKAFTYHPPEPKYTAWGPFYRTKSMPCALDEVLIYSISFQELRKDKVGLIIWNLGIT